MKKITLLFLCLLLLTGCSFDKSRETFIVSGTVAEIRHFYSTDILVETEAGVKIPLYEGRYADFTFGLQKGDKVSFIVEKVEGDGYKIIGLNLEN